MIFLNESAQNVLETYILWTKVHDICSGSVGEENLVKLTLPTVHNASAYPYQLGLGEGCCHQKLDCFVNTGPKSHSDSVMAVQLLILRRRKLTLPTCDIVARFVVVLH